MKPPSFVILIQQSGLDIAGEEKINETVYFYSVDFFDTTGMLTISDRK